MLAWPEIHGRWDISMFFLKAPAAEGGAGALRRASARRGGGAFSGAQKGRTSPQRRRPGVSGSEHLPGVQPGGHTVPRRVASRPFRPVERSAAQSRKAVFNRRRGARILRGLGTTARSEDATNVTGATPRARWSHSGHSSRIMCGERLPQRGKSESRAGWTEHCISRVQRTGNAVRSCGRCRDIFRQRRESEQRPPDREASKKASPLTRPMIAIGEPAANETSIMIWSASIGIVICVRRHLYGRSHACE